MSRRSNCAGASAKLSVLLGSISFYTIAWNGEFSRFHQIVYSLAKPTGDNSLLNGTRGKSWATQGV